MTRLSVPDDDAAAAGGRRPGEIVSECCYHKQKLKKAVLSKTKVEGVGTKVVRTYEEAQGRASQRKERAPWRNRGRCGRGGRN